MIKNILLIETGPKSLRESLVKTLLANKDIKLYVLKNAKNPALDLWIKDYVKEEKIFYCDFSHKELFRKEFEDLLKKIPFKFDGVIASREDYVFHANEAARAAGAPPVSKYDSNILRNKFFMRQAFNEAALPFVKTILAEKANIKPQDLEGFSESVVVKPTELLASLGVEKGDTRDIPGINKLINKAILTDVPESLRINTGIVNSAVIEDYIKTKGEVSVEGYVYRGKFTPLAVTQKFVTKEPFFMETGHIVPAALSYDAKKREKLFETVQQMCGALGLYNTAVHAELREGLADDNFYPVELGARLAGDYIPYLVKQAAGVDMDNICALLSADADPSFTFDIAKQKAVGVQFIDAAYGQPLKQSPKDERVTVYPAKNVLNRIGHIFITAPDRETLVKDMRAVCDKIGIPCIF